ncbi:MAG: CoA transferase [Roseivirga sp.]|nr:CoA transferase [Roseivirga sp.]
MFDKLRVVELASVLAGPSVGQFFAELGAEVIKIENPDTRGDVTRSWLFSGEKRSGSLSSYFSSVNWGKKSALLNLKNPEPYRVLHNLIKDADIVIASYKPGDAEKLQVDYDTLSQINPAIIYGHITGYGTNDHRVGYDAVIQAESGFMSINGERGGDGLKMPVALIDVLAGHQLKQGILVSLINRMISGKGSYVPVSLIDAAVSSLANQSANWLVGGVVPSRTGNEHPNIAPYGDVFKTIDNKEVILAVGNDRQFQSLNRVLGIKLDLSEDFNSNSNRVLNRSSLNEKLSESIGVWNATDLVAKLGECGVPIGVVKKINEIFAQAPEHWLLEDGGMTGVRTFMAAPDVSSTKLPLSAPPELGANTLDIMERYG